MKKSTGIIALFLLLIFIQFAYGDNTEQFHSRNYRGLLTILFGIVFICVLYFKTRKSRIQIKKSEEKDPFWNYEKMTKHTEYVFSKIQQAWAEKNLSVINELMTENGRKDLELKINHLIFLNETEKIENIDIERVKIIGSEDYIGKDSDTFTAYISASMINYTISGLTGNITRNSFKSFENYKYIYYFKRNNDTWLVDKIEYGANIKDLYKSKHFIE